jgi:2-polyprenyl-6-methoxyphenol hydroxylase-like FAD-dependent oxidoreductase
MSEDPNVIISGGGIAGLLLAISLKKLNINCQVYEQAPAYAEGVGGAIGTFQAYIGLYPNGLRIIRDISLELLYEIRSLGRPFTLRKWMRHDGSTIAVGQEK